LFSGFQLLKKSTCQLKATGAFLLWDIPAWWLLFRQHFYVNASHQPAIHENELPVPMQ
jgi:hypothetical protein